MAKGFGKPSSNSPSGYILLLVPESGIYASTDPFGDDDNYVGITNSLEMARVWRKRKDIQRDLGPYIEWLADEYYDSSQTFIEIEIRALYKNENRKISTKLAQALVLERRNL